MCDLEMVFLARPTRKSPSFGVFSVTLVGRLATSFCGSSLCESLRLINGKGNKGWLRNCLYLMTQYIVRTYPSYYLYHVVLRKDHGNELVVYPYYCKYAKPGNNTPLPNLGVSYSSNLNLFVSTFNCSIYLLKIRPLETLMLFDKRTMISTSFLIPKHRTSDS